MAMYGPKQTLSQKLQQKLSPQQIQLMKLLQIPTATLEQRIEEELEINPALEIGDESADLTEGMSDMDLEDRDLDFYEREKKAESNVDFEDSDVTSNSPQEDTPVNEDKGDYDDDEIISSRDDDIELDDYMVNFIEDDPST